jgi:hypothetical protein
VLTSEAMTSDERRVAGIFAILVVVAFLYSVFNFAASAKLSLIPTQLNIPRDSAISYLILCLIIAGFTVAFIQISRMLFPIRGLFHSLSFYKFLAAGETSKVESTTSTEPATSDGAPKRPVSVQKAVEEFLRRGYTSRPQGGKLLDDKTLAADRVFDLPIEQLCGQITLTFQMALDNPDLFMNFISCIVGEDGATQLGIITTNSPTIPETPDGKVAMIKVAEARALLMRMGQQNIDSFQIGTGGDWRRLIRSVVLLLCIWSSWTITPTPFHDKSSNLGGWLSPLSDYVPNVLKVFFEPTHLAQSIFLGLASAYLATLLRDLAAIVERKRYQS